jgi:dihydrodipicolinate synthase/N-acetylneuraminate lyase
MRPEGALVAMATPFRDNGSIHRVTLRKLVDFLIERGVDGIFAASTVGEFVHLSDEQRYELVSLTVKFADGRVPVLAGAADISPKRVIEHCRQFKRAGASLATIAPPFYYPMSQEDLVSHYEQIADSIDMPFVLYNIPQFCNPLRVETILRVVETCKPSALKNSNTDVTEMMTLLNALRATKVSYLVGPDELLFAGLELGAHGCMSGMTGTIPEGVRALIDAFRAGQVDVARRIQYAFLELLQLAADLPFPFALKVMLSVRGFDMGPPIHAQSEATRKRIAQKKSAIARKIESILKLLS